MKKLMIVMAAALLVGSAAYAQETMSMSDGKMMQKNMMSCCQMKDGKMIDMTNMPKDQREQCQKMMDDGMMKGCMMKKEGMKGMQQSDGGSSKAEEHHGDKK